MDKKIIQFEIDGQKVFIEGDLPKDGGKMIAASPGKTIVEATSSFEQTLDPIMAFAGKIMERVAGLKIEKPDSLELEFGIKLSGAVNFWVISGTGEGNINLKLSWNKE